MNDMKKILLFAMMLVAGVMAFTGCKKDKDKVDSPLVGTWSVWEQEDMYYEITFNGDGSYTYINDYYFYDQETGKKIPTPHEHIVIKGSYTINGDIATVHNESQTLSMDGGPAEPSEGWQPTDEKMKFKVEGKTLHLTRDYGTEYPWDMTLTK